MGFLSRKNKNKSASTSVVEEPLPMVDEPHPIVEELQRMEEVVPETPVEPPAPEPAAAEVQAEVAEPVAPTARVEVVDEEPERFMPRDLLAPSRHEPVIEQ